MSRSFDFISTFNDRPWRVKLLLKGEAYGRNNCLTAERPYVEFWDLHLAGKEGQSGHVWPEDGQFAARYCLSTLLNRNNNLGIDLLSYVDSWKISSEDFIKVRGWLADTIEEKLGK
jgi:hypothetical protein